jgi:2-polyprenyl-3-methyl-5-hydroxy-6-metoxy-1,4-benzoquinol methylase
MITQWSHGAADANMAEELLTEVGHLVRRHPWWQARARRAARLLRTYDCQPPARVLDAGCGWGVTLTALEQSGYLATGLDISRRALMSLETPSRRLVEADLSTAPPESEWGSFDAVLALDVIEHVDDDRGVVANLAKLVPSGGHIIISVPALPDLYSEFDSVQGHRRRYTTATLRRAFEGTGLTLLTTFWWGAWMVPVLRLQRRRPVRLRGLSTLETYREYLRLPRWPATMALALAFRVDERLALNHLNPIGTSLFAVARR